LRYIRFRDDHGDVHYGVEQADGRAMQIDGDLFGEHEVTRRLARPARLLAPCQPPNVIAIGLNYRAHADESGSPYPPAPIIFIKAATAVVGPGEAILLPRAAPDNVDYEAELAIVIGRKAKHVEPGEALDYVLGYTCGNDVSARDCQLRIDKQWARAKSFDTFCPLGPAIVDGLDPASLPIRLRLNGKTMQDSNTNDMICGPADLVSYLSHQMTLLPGTVILSGTPSGVGFPRKPPVFLRPGDRVEIEIGGIGVLANGVEAE
jgi:2-keto-4-pentenoate hydratase/2-oxohepta-3-ene-1,7-dioic acid hydratase in catechol pathway